MSRLTDLKFLTREEQDAAFKAAKAALSTLLIQGRLTREGHRNLLTMINTLSATWYAYQADDNGAAREEERTLE